MKSRVDFSFMRALHELLNIGKQSKNCKYLQIFYKYFRTKVSFFGGGGERGVKTKIGWKTRILNYSNKPYVTLENYRRSVNTSKFAQRKNYIFDGEGWGGSKLKSNSNKPYVTLENYRRSVNTSKFAPKKMIFFFFGRRGGQN